MSLQNLLELDDLGKSFSPSKRNADLPKPKPRPRPRQMLSPSGGNPYGGDGDDVMSITSVESGDSNVMDKKPPKAPKHPKFFSSSSKSAYDNVAFVSHDDDDDDSHPVSESSEKSNRAVRPQPRKRNSLVSGIPVAKTLTKQKQSYQFSSREEDSDVGKSDKDDESQNFSSPRKEQDDDDSRSDATFTVENEKYKDKQPVSNRPPTPSKIPRLRQRKDKKKPEIVKSSNEPKKKIGSRKKSESESLATPEKEKREYVAVPIENDDDNATDGNNDKTAVDESESASVSSSAPPTTTTTTKDNKKSRFGKFFGSSSSDNKKRKTASSLKKDKNRSTDESEKPAGKSSLVNRWRKSANTFLKTSSKPIEEEAASAAGDTVDESRSSKPSSPHPSQKSADTQISMPESGSDRDNIGSSANSEDEEEHGADKENVSREKVKEVKKKDSVTDKAKDEAREPIKEIFKPFGKLLRSRSKDKETESLKQKDDKKEDMKGPETVKKTDSKAKFKEITSKLMSEPKPKSPKRKEIPPSDLSSSADEQDKYLGESESEMDSGTELPIKKKDKKSPSIKRRPLKPVEPLELIDAESKKELLMGFTIHSSDLLPIDPNVVHPVVKVSVMLQNGQYLKRGNHPDEEATHHEKKSKDRRRKKSGLFEGTENVSKSILPIMTQPCQARHSIPTFAPTWNELLVFEEPFRRFVTRNGASQSDNDPIILFEVMDFLPMTSNGSSVSGFHGTESGWYKVAWAFLKPIGGNGVMNVNRKLRLQLYKPIKLRSKEKIEGPEVFAWWKCGRKEKVNATLYVTPKGIRTPETRTASLRQLLSMRKDHLTQAILDSQLATRKHKKEKSRKQSLFELREQANWSRMEGQSCKPPNKHLASLPSSQIESLNIVISGNVHCIKFSPCGYKLAAGLDTDELHVVLIFEVPSWTLLKSLTGHHGIIYDIAWKLFELDDYTSYHYMASASADSTVRVWKMDNHQEKTISLFKVLYHPSYVYTVKFHPTHPSLLASGCFDGIIRIWDIKPEHDTDTDLDKKKKSKRKDRKRDEVSPIILLDKHNSFVNCLVFDQDGLHLYSGDGAAYLYKWGCMSPSQKKSWKLDRDAKLHPGNVPINSIDLHPSGNRILLHLRDNFIKILDAFSFIPLQTFSGLNNERFQIRSCFSPCGNLVLSGSEQNTLCIWDADTGKILQFINPRSYPQCTVTSVDYHPFDYYVATGLTSDISEPSPVLIYHYNQPSKMNYPLLKKTAMKMRASLDKIRSQSSQSIDDTTEEREPRDRDNRRGPLSAKRGSSTEKFVSIIHKLDSALYLAHQQKKKRETEAKSSTCLKKVSESVSEPSTTLPENPNPAGPPPPPTRKSNVGNSHSEMVISSSARYAKKLPDRPRSASSSSREMYAHSSNKTNDVVMQRDAKSDSEQPYQFKVPSPRKRRDKGHPIADEDDLDKHILKTVKPTSKTDLVTSKPPRSPRSQGDMAHYKYKH